MDGLSGNFINLRGRDGYRNVTMQSYAIKVFLCAALAGERVLVPYLYIILRGTHPV